MSEEEFDSEVEVKEEPRVVGKLENGVCDVSNQNLSSLFCLGVQYKLQQLNASNNQLTSLKSLKQQPMMTFLDISGNPIENIDGFNRLTKLEELLMLDTPISTLENWRLAIINTVPSLKKLNNEEITDEERENAKNFTDFDSFTSDSAKYDNAVNNQLKNNQIKKYHQFHQGEFKDFAQNEALLWDLQNSGPCPKITDTSSDEDLKRAIISLRHRNRKLADTFLKC